jgi:hypothetical protein
LACWSVDVIRKRSEHLAVVAVSSEKEALASHQQRHVCFYSNRFALG